MAGPLISIDQLEVRIGRDLTGAELAQAEAFIEDASALIRRFVAPTDPNGLWVNAPHGVPGDLVPIVVRVVNRALSNPHGLDSETVGSHTWRKEGNRSSGIHLTPEDESDIASVAGRAQLRVATLVSPWSGDGPVSLAGE